MAYTRLTASEAAQLIKNGDTLAEIAPRNHTTVGKLKRLNKISGTNSRAGKKIRVK